MEIPERLALFFRRLEAAPACGSSDEAMNLVCRLIEEVEDEFCPLPRQTPAPLTFTGRMYAPRQDRMRRLPNGSLVADARHHRIYCNRDGSILIVRVADRKVELSKPGKPQ